MSVRRSLSRMLLLGALPCMVVAAAAVTALTAGSPWKKVEVPFAFLAGDAELVPGTYQVLAWKGDAGLVVKIKGPGGESQVPVVTRLARTTASAIATNLVFDAVDGKRRLSEVWIAGDDGYLVRGNVAEEEHEHVILKGEGSN